MPFRTTTADRVEATAYARESDAREVLAHLNYLTADFFQEDQPHSYSGDVYQTYKVTITIEPA